eukprot:TRINITY_DN32388_c0_g1_i1.p1 TRINITY_DN32388_c0_g1~~TRINITY_DN32388_c0_g1_i1.p1  ORF type:complete len:371 (+),score=83.31 TRINITY_DN32388_c0_g1_i1:70-1182(+)
MAELACCDEILGVAESDIGVLLADGSVHPLIRSGEVLPRERTALLTTVAENQKAVAAALVTTVGVIPESDIALAVAVLPRPTYAAERSMPQLLLRVRFTRDGGGWMELADVAAEKPSVRRVDFGSGGGSTGALHRWLPGLWTYASPYTHRPHPGFYFGDRYLKVTTKGVTDSRVEDAAQDIDPSATADKVWPAAYYLARHLVSSRLAEGQTVAELGAGVHGLGGLAAAACGARRVVVTDLPEHEEALACTCRSNGPWEKVQVRAAAADWCDAGARERLRELACGDGFDVTAAADCVFWPSLFEPLLDTAEAITRPGGAVFLTIVDRVKWRTEEFLSALSRRGWDVRRIPQDPSEKALRCLALHCTVPSRR